MGSLSRDVNSCTHWLRPRNSLPPPRNWTRITRALLVSKDRRHLFVTPCSYPLKWEIERRPVLYTLRSLRLRLIVHSLRNRFRHAAYVAQDGIGKLLRSPVINSKEPIPPSYECNLSGRYDNPIRTRLLAPMDCSKIPEPEFLNF